MDRRKFIKNAASFVSLPLFLNGQAIQVWGAEGGINPGDTNGKVLVLIHLDGGNDGLNTLVPLDMYDNLVKVRPEVVLDEKKILPLTQLQGVHPSMTQMKQMYEEENLLFIQNVGYPEPNLSHFRSKEIILSASDSQTVISSGWFGRYLEMLHPEYPEGYPNAFNPHPLAVSIGGSSSPTCQGEMNNMSIVLQNLNSSYQSQSEGKIYPDTPYGYELEFVTQVMLSTEKYLEVVNEAADISDTQSSLWPSEENKLANKLKMVARLIAGGLATPIYIVNLGGFDTHANQVIPGATHTGKHAELLQYVSEAAYAFQDELKLMGKQDDVLSLIYSEFGRRVASNKSDGTDHGAAFPMMLFGSKVNPAVLGENPVIPEKVERKTNVPMDVDFRSIYASLLNKWFEVDESDIKNILFNDFEILPILKSSVQVGDTYYTTDALKIMPVYPNPLHNQAEIQYATNGGYITLKLYNLNGALVQVLVDAQVPRGSQFVIFYRKGLTSGNYLLVLQNGIEKVTQKLAVQ
jgi:uncharacterized protein (DUF1501 family)